MSLIEEQIKQSVDRFGRDQKEVIETFLRLWLESSNVPIEQTVMHTQVKSDGNIFKQEIWFEEMK